MPYRNDRLDDLLRPSPALTPAFANKPKPYFFKEFLRKHTTAQIVFISVDWPCVKFIQRVRGICLLCDKPSSTYDLAFCFNREVWILYSDPEHFAQAMQLGETIQLHGAKSVSIILVHPSLLNENYYDLSTNIHY